MYKRILVPIDGSDTSNRGLREAIRLAKNQHASLRLLHVLDQLGLLQQGEAAIYADELMKKIEQLGRGVLTKAEVEAENHGVRAEAILYKKITPVADAIVEQAQKWRADLIVLGTHGRRGITRVLMGSDAEMVVRNSPVPVLLIPSKAAPRSRRRRR